MSLKELSHEELKTKSMLELAHLVLEDAKKALPFQELFEEVSERKGFSKQVKEDKISQFYTELNVDGRFMTTGDNMWGLKQWYPVDQADEEITTPPKKKRKTKKKTEEEDELELEEDLNLVELGDEEKEDEADFKPLGEDLDVEEEDLEEEISDESDTDEEEEKY